MAHVMVKDEETARALVAALLYKSAFFVVDPQPDGAYQVQFQDEHAKWVLDYLLKLPEPVEEETVAMLAADEACPICGFTGQIYMLSQQIKGYGAWCAACQNLTLLSDEVEALKQDKDPTGPAVETVLRPYGWLVIGRRCHIPEEAVLGFVFAEKAVQVNPDEAARFVVLPPLLIPEPA